ncbi:MULTISPECIES: hypothetical protein [unclassified Pantoea]|uniref:hypothetical protein n=1 Tax=unclassified Pantoea TaxID=2630326 RepID=UPI001CD36472|nr:MULTISPECIES: hypothetical protein [unclassified Pantoea]MCA1179813.1 hypothetical protein [Pantoea sp. alder69]MCA1253585.1 hypothetical protein [Pantoea sp. alder70]MCA1268299.1 hypothetical protein [Pantoea sp. alder81]
MIILKLDDAEFSELTGKIFSSRDDYTFATMTKVIDVRMKQGKQIIVHEIRGKKVKTPLSVFLLRFPYLGVGVTTIT